MSEEQKQAICRRFSKAAATYDEHARVQQQCAVQLAAWLPAGFSPAEILEIGCGTGGYTRLLAEKYPTARVTALDFSAAMVKQARKKCAPQPTVRILCEDAESYLAQNRQVFGLVTSNATLQWFDDPALALYHAARSLAAGGLFLASCFGPETLHELGAGLADAFSAVVELPAARFPDQDRIRRMTSACFDEITIKELIYRLSYASVQELLRQISKTGTGGYHPLQPRLTRGRLNRLEKWFADRGGPALSYQVFLVLAARPQRKEPLRDE